MEEVQVKSFELCTSIQYVLDVPADKKVSVRANDGNRPVADFADYLGGISTQSVKASGEQSTQQTHNFPETLAHRSSTVGQSPYA